MLEYEIAAIYYFVASVVSVHPYFEEVPEDLLVPCVFYPTPEQDTQAYSVSTYATESRQENISNSICRRSPKWMPAYMK